VKPCDVGIDAHRSTESQSLALRQPATHPAPCGPPSPPLRGKLFFARERVRAPR
jgi:hypothetical protein